jgi:hypothetical protein
VFLGLADIGKFRRIHEAAHRYLRLWIPAEAGAAFLRDAKASLGPPMNAGERG